MTLAAPVASLRRRFEDVAGGLPIFPLAVLFFLYFFECIIFRKFICLPRWLWQTITLAASRDIVQTCLKTDAVA